MRLSNVRVSCTKGSWRPGTLCHLSQIPVHVVLVVCWLYWSCDWSKIAGVLVWLINTYNSSNRINKAASLSGGGLADSDNHLVARGAAKANAYQKVAAADNPVRQSHIHLRQRIEVGHLPDILDSQRINLMRGIFSLS